MKKIKIIYIVSILFISFNLIKCNLNQNKKNIREGKSNKNEYPKRIISLTTAATEIIFELGAGDRIVGVSSNSNYPPEVSKIKKIGSSYGSVNIEMVLSLKPDLIICSKSQTEIFKEYGIKTYGTTTCTLNDVYKLILEIGEIIGKSSEAEKIVTLMKKRINEIVEKQKRFDKKPLVYFESGKTFGKTRGKGSLTNDLIELAGGKNIGSELVGAFPILSNEFIIEKNPDIIIVEEYGASIDEIKKREAWHKIKAVQKNKILKVPIYYTNYTPRCVEAIEAFYKFFYEEK
ncbi:MAG TPA: ABC transporter substrate-binding protein [bacterium]|nr:ABC transporter substrate-binding protein [bacterium]HOL48174.1 ABC transporter substrate-binding protein [bacterium]HPQ19392.1 ABC transporter substrate-binding protein [bacterium]